MHHARHLLFGFLAASGLLVLSLAPAALAQQPDLRVQRPRPDDSRLKPIARPRSTASCAEYGVGYVRVEGTRSCVRLGGAIDVGVAGSR
ncbi:MAG: porin [Afipia sp.]